MDSIITEKCCYFGGNDAKKVGINLLIFIDRRLLFGNSTNCLTWIVIFVDASSGRMN